MVYLGLMGDQFSLFDMEVELQLSKGVKGATRREQKKGVVREHGQNTLYRYIKMSS